MIRTIALDDQPPALQIVSHFCNQIEFVDLQQAFSRTADAAAWLATHPVDLIILDINMPAISGIDFYKSLASISTVSNPTSPNPIAPTPTVPRPMVIFTTAYSEYAVEGFSLSAIDYLLKPFTFERFLQALTKAREYHSFTRQSPQPDTNIENPDTPNHILLRADYGFVRITLTDILFIEGLDNYIRISLQDQDPIIIRITMKALLEKLPLREFMRVHRSWIVPLGRISNVRNKTLTVAGREIPLGASYEAEFFKAFGQ